MMIEEMGEGVTYVRQGSRGKSPETVKTLCPYPFLEEAVRDQRVKRWWQSQRSFFEGLNPFDLAQKFHNFGAKAEVAAGNCLTLGIADAPPVTVSFSRAAMVYRFLFLG